MICKKQEGRYTTLEEVGRQVEMDYQRKEKMKRKDEAVKRIINTYNVQINL